MAKGPRSAAGVVLFLDNILNKVSQYGKPKGDLEKLCEAEDKFIYSCG